jgi:tetratricopeptide (TPR) repeat protein
MLHLTNRLAICFAILFATGILAAEDPPYASSVERKYRESQERMRKQPGDVPAMIDFCAAAFNWAELAQKDSQRAAIASQAIDVAREALRRNPTNAAAHYWLGMNLGQLARTKSLGALSLVRQMETEFHEARRLNERIDYAGPHRSLGYLYRDAPGWPTSVGNKRKAREHFERAVQLHPEFPDNQLGLLESFEQWSDRKNFESRFPAVERCMNEARKKFTGPEWEQSWADWEKHWDALKAKAPGIGKQVPSKGAK